MNAESIHISRNVEICQKNSGLAYMVFLGSKAKSFTLNQTMEFFPFRKKLQKIGNVYIISGAKPARELVQLHYQKFLNL